MLLRIQLVERFYDPLSGNVLIDGHPISQLNVQDYRKHLALVSQEPVSIHRLRSLVSLTDVDLSDSLCRQYSLQHPSWSDQTDLRSDTRGARRGLQGCQHPGLHQFSARVCNYVLFFWLVVNYCCSGFETNVGGKGSQLSGGQKRMFGKVVHLPHLTNNQNVLRSLGHSSEIPRFYCLMR